VGTRNFTITLTWVGRKQYPSLISLSVRGEQEHVDQNYGHTNVKLHFGRFLQQLKNFFFRRNNSELGTCIEITIAIVLQIPYIQLITFIFADKTLIMHCLES